MDKLTDPTFLRATGPGSIGQQLDGYLYLSPIAPLVRAFALPAPVLVGALIAIAEVGVGIGILTGLAYRLSAFGGFALSVMFWLTASWATHPYYFGNDLPYAAGWLVLAIGGPVGWSIAHRLDRFVPPPDPDAVRPQGEVVSRRQVIRMAAEVAVVGVAAAVVGGAAWLLSGAGTATATAGAPSPSPAPSPLAPTPRLPSLSSSPAPSTLVSASASPTGSAGDVVANLADIARHHALAVTDPVTGDAAVLFRLASGQVVGYDAACTHEGCPVEFDAGSELLVCPCHGAVFDPAHQARVLAGPTRRALLELPLHIDPATGAITFTT